MNAPQKTAVSIAELQRRIGEEIGVSQWHAVNQDMIDRFADVTSDHQFIHVDPVRAKAETPFGGTIAHGYLLLSLVAPMSYEALPQIEGRVMGINYGLDKVRFLAPVRAGSRLRGHFKLREVSPRSEKEVLLKNEIIVELEGADKPALYAESLSVIVLK